MRFTQAREDDATTLRALHQRVEGGAECSAANVELYTHCLRIQRLAFPCRVHAECAT